MDTITSFLHQFTSTDGLKHLIASGGYIALFIIIFAETGLLLGFFLPGDSLLVTAGLLIATHVVDMNIFLLIALLIVAAVLGDATGYFIGRKAGAKLYNRPNSRFFKREHLLKTHAFYEKHGGQTIIFARFIPVVRTFAPVVAGAANMGYKKFAFFNIIGGVLWITAATLLGYLLASVVPDIDHYLQYVIAAVVFISILPPLIEWLKSRKSRASLES